MGESAISIAFHSTPESRRSRGSGTTVCAFLGALVVVLSTMSWELALAQIPAPATGRIPTLAPLVREVTPAVVNISVKGTIREDNPLYGDPVFREFFDVPRQLERQFHATGSGVIVDAQRGYVLTANHVVAQISIDGCLRRPAIYEENI
jgi:S1-C subfamily serine protease